MKKIALIVDAYSAGNLLAPEFKKRGFDCVHVQSTPEIFHILRPSFVPTDFVANMAFSGDRAALLSHIREFPVVSVMPGTETGVHLADEISESLGLKSNGLKKSAARRNKYLMIETLRASGLLVAQQNKSPHALDQIAFKRDARLDKVVVKPVESAGSEDVRICTSDEQVRLAHEAIVGKVNMLGLLNQESIIQEFLEGDEYFINSVSLHGQHVVCDIWRHNKRGLNGFDFVYDFAELCDPAGTLEQELIKYNRHALDALNIKFGPSHCEIIMTKAGPRMVEMGARLQGMSLPTLNEQCFGAGPVDMAVNCYVDEPQFLASAAHMKMRKRAMRVNLISHQAGVLRKFGALDQIERLPSFFHLRTIAKPGYKIEKTINYFTVAGFVVLACDNREQIFADYQMIRRLEEEGQILNYE